VGVCVPTSGQHEQAGSAIEIHDACARQITIGFVFAAFEAWIFSPKQA